MLNNLNDVMMNSINDQKQNDLIIIMLKERRLEWEQSVKREEEDRFENTYMLN